MNERPRIKTSIVKMNLSVLKFVFKFCPLYVIFAIISIASSVVVAISEVTIIAKAIELVVHNADLHMLYNSLIKYVIIITVCYIFKILYGRYILPRYRMIYRMKMQTFLFSKVKHIDMESYDDPEFYDKFARALNDSTWRGIAVFNTFVDFMQSVCISIALGAYVIITDWVLIATILISAIVDVLVVNFTNKTWYKVYRKTENDHRYQRYVQRTFYQQKFAAEIKTTPISELLVERYDKAVDSIEDIYRSAEKRLMIPNGFAFIIDGFIKNALTYVYLAYKLFKNDIGIDVFTATANATFKFSTNFIRAISIYTNLREHSYYINDFLWITSYEPKVEKNEGLEASEFKEIKIDDICFAYPKNDHNSINHLSMNFKNGEKIAIVGDNGGGKTTLTKLLLKFYNPSSGAIYFNGINLKEYNEASIRKQYSIVYQDFQIYAISIAENVLMRKVRGKEDEEIVKMALEKVGLLEKINSFEKGIYTQVTREFDRDGATFSGGERQRLVISRVFASDANVYILDEPTSALDPLSEERINKLIIQNVTGKAMIIIAHRLSTVVDADRIYLIRNGTVTESGTHKELMEKKGHYYEMFTTQTELYLKKEK